MESEIVTTKSDGSALMQSDEDLKIELIESSAEGHVFILTDDQLKHESLIDDDTNYPTVDDNNQEPGVSFEEQNSKIELYSCNSCNLTFSSVTEHIQKYHFDQDVVLQVGEEDSIEKHIDDARIVEIIPEELTEDIETSSISNFVIEDATISSLSNSGCIIMDANDIKSFASDIDHDMSNVQILHIKSILDDQPPRKIIKLEQLMDYNKSEKTFSNTVLRIGKADSVSEIEIEGNEDADVSVLTFEEDALNKTLNTEHEVTHLYCCVNCNIQFRSIESLEKHSCKMNEGENPTESNLTDDSEVSKIYYCVKCNAPFPSIKKLESHSCNYRGNYKCFHCDLNYNNSKSFCAHMKTHKNMKTNAEKQVVKPEKSNKEEPDASGKYECKVCCTVLPSNRSLSLHKRMHNPIKTNAQLFVPMDYKSSKSPEIPPVLNVGDKPDQMNDYYHCSECSKWIHVGFRCIHDSTHSGKVEYNCSLCNKKLHTEENLALHMNVHNTGKVYTIKTGKNLRYQCKYCERMFSKPHEKVKHERIHTGEKPYNCNICNKSFRVSYCLTLHMRTHTGARPYECEHCGKKFKSYSVYNHHLQIHSDVRAYKCPHCPKAFKTSVQLAGHKNSHTKPFSCTECNRPFGSLYAVRIHMESHRRTNNLKFKCQLCGASYARKFALKDHVKAQHNSTISTNAEEKDLEPENDVAAQSIIPKYNLQIEELCDEKILGY